MKTIHYAVGLVAYVLFVEAAFAGQILGVPLGIQLGLQLGSALPLGSVGLLSVAAVGLIVGIRAARKKRSK